MNKQKQVLLVDDDQEYIYLVQEAIQVNNPRCDLRVMNTGDDLLVWLETNRRPSLILLDIQMPGSNGFEVLGTLKSSDRYKAIPVVMLTASEQRTDIVRSYQQGANGFVTKPITFTDLQHRLGLLSHYWFDIAQTPGS
ncbi:response regulator [Spirosoma aerophilum]